MKNDAIIQAKAWSNCIDLFRRYWPDHYRERGNSVCPFHGDSDPSLSVSRDKVHCFAEGKSWDAIDLYEAGTGLGKKDAVAALCAELGIATEYAAGASRIAHKARSDAKTGKDASVPVDHVERWKKLVSTALTEDAMLYWSRRSLPETLAADLQKTGLLGFDAKRKAVAFPVTDPGKKELLGIQFVPVDGAPKKFAKGTNARRGFFRYGTGTDYCVVTEAVIDALSVHAACPNLSLEVVSVYSASQWKNVGELGGTPVLFFDNDPGGIKATCRALRAFTGKIRIVDWSIAPEGCKDVNDLLKQGHAVVIERMVRLSRCPRDDGEVSAAIAGQLDRLDAHVEALKNGDPKRHRDAQTDLERFRKEMESDGGVPELSDVGAAGRRKEPPQAKLLVELCRSDTELFHTPAGDSYATIIMNRHHETLAIRSKRFGQGLARKYYERYGKVPSSQARHDACSILEAIATYEGPERSVYLRVAADEGKLFLDLADSAWRQVEISSNGWRVISSVESPIRFRRTPGMLPLPEPERGGTWESLRRRLNVNTEDSFRMIVAWLVQAIKPQGPYPILILQGEQGSAKSTLGRVLKTAVDPSSAPIRSSPREERDLMVSALHGHILAFDNLSGLPVWLSDALCRLSTGGGFACRTLYADQEETIFQAARPVILNGIDAIATRHDLADRAIIVTLPAIPEEKRLLESSFWQDFKTDHPRLLGLICDAASSGLQGWGKVKLPRLPRMADFATWVAACEPALPWRRGEFMEAYVENRKDSIETSLDTDPVASAIQHLMTTRDRWVGTRTELLVELKGLVPEEISKSKGWPKAANKLSGRLVRLASFLREIGLVVSNDRGSGRDRKRLVRIDNRRNLSSAPSVLSASALSARNEMDYVRTIQDVGPTAVSSENACVSSVTIRHTHPSSTREAASDNGSCHLADGTDDADDRIPTLSSGPTEEAF